MPGSTEPFVRVWLAELRATRQVARLRRRDVQAATGRIELVAYLHSQFGAQTPRSLQSSSLSFKACTQTLPYVGRPTRQNVLYWKIMCLSACLQPVANGKRRHRSLQSLRM